jgi:hypothetical protein
MLHKYGAKVGKVIQRKSPETLIWGYSLLGMVFALSLHVED